MRVSAHWRKAPYALAHHRSVLLAVFVASLLAALASSSAPFVTTAAASEALKNKLSDLSPYATGLELKISKETFGTESAAALARSNARYRSAVAGLRSRLPHLGRPIFTTAVRAAVSGPKGASAVVLVARTEALAHVKLLRQVRGPGVWIADITAQDAHLRPGDVLRVDGLQSFGRPGGPRLRVKGVYRALAHSPQTDYWGNFFQDIYPQCPDCGVPPSFLFVDERSLERLLGGRNAALERIAELPADSTDVTLAAARSLDRKFDTLRSGLRRSALGKTLGCSRFAGQSCLVISSLSAAVTLADRNASAVTPAVTLLSDLGTALALAIAAAAGIFLVRRRRSEAALLYARGEAVGAFAARSAVETLMPMLVGGAAGFALAYVLTDAFAPSGSISSATVWSAAAHAAVAVGVADALLVACAAVSFLHLFDTGMRGRLWLRRLPWEAALLAAAVVLYLRIRSGGGVTHGAAHAPTLAVFVFPLLLVAAVAGMGARAGRLLLRVGARRARGARPPVYLALRRLAAARSLVVMLAVVSAASLGAYFYVETLATSLHHTTLEKAYMATGSDANVLVQETQRLPRTFAYPIARVQFANQGASTADGTPIDVMLVDPPTLARTLHWQGDWGPSPAPVLDELGRARSQPLPVIVTPDLTGRRAILIGADRVPIRVLASVRAFPFMAQGIPLVITSYRALDEFEARAKVFDPLGVLSTYVWAKGPPATVGRALASLEPIYPASTIDTFLRAPDVVLATRTFTFMRMIAIGAGVLALLGLLLYLQARQRSQAIASVLAQRMGLSRAAETVSLCLELVTILAFAAAVGGAVAIAAAAPVVRKIDPLPADPPSPVFSVPSVEIVVAAAVLAVVALTAGALTSWLARRTDLSEALRVA